MSVNRKSALGAEEVFGLHSFTNPQNAWNVICANWGSDAEQMAVLDDNRFRQSVIEQAIIAIVHCKTGQITKTHLMDCLCLGDCITNYLVDFNFFYYSDAKKKFYTSVVDINESHWMGEFTESEIGIYKELDRLHNFRSLVDKALKFVSANALLFDLYNKDEVLDALLEIYWNNKPDL